VKGRTHVHCVLHHPEGINLDALGEVHSALQPRLETLLEDDDLYIEFSSPGIERRFKSFHEFQVFLGKRAKVLLVDGMEWIEGTIMEADDTRCLLAIDGETERILSPEGVIKARLTD
ncbi:MAG: ribosome assembly cofactor RimP, partial [Alkalispirochaeta sp.]